MDKIVPITRVMCPMPGCNGSVDKLHECKDCKKQMCWLCLLEHEHEDLLAPKKEVPPKRKAFLRARKGGLGSSDVSSLFPEDCKYACPRRLVYDKRGVKPDFKRTESEEALLERGTVLEPIAADKFVKDYGFDIRKVEGDGVVKGKQEHYRASPDYVIENASFGHIAAFWPQLDFNEDPGPGVCEIKTSNLFVFQKMVKEGLLIDYQLQVQWQMFVTGYTWGVYSIFEPGFWQLRSWPMVPAKNTINEMVKRVDAIMPVIEDHSLPLPDKLPPGDKRCIGCQWRHTCKGMPEKCSDDSPAISSEFLVDESYAESLSDLRKVREQKQKVEEIEAMVIASIQEQMQLHGQSKVSTPSVGATITWEKRNGARRWDSKGLDAEGSDIGRKMHFCRWIMENGSESMRDLIAEFQLEHKKSPTLADKFKKQSEPTRPFIVKFDAEDKKYENS